MKSKKQRNKGKENNLIQDLWIRLAVLIVGIILFYPIGLLLLIIILINMIYTAIKKYPNKELVRLSDALSKEINKVLRYLLFVSKERPFKL